MFYEGGTASLETYSTCDEDETFIWQERGTKEKT